MSTEPKPAKKAAVTPIPQVEEVPDLTPADVRQQEPAPDAYTGGLFVRNSDKEEYALAVHDEDTYGRTHSLKNSRHFWQGTKEAFKAEFEPKK